MPQTPRSLHTRHGGGSGSLFNRRGQHKRWATINELGWDEGVTPDQIAGRYWHELTGVLQAAAQILDYTEDLWNEELAQMLSDTETAAGE